MESNKRFYARRAVEEHRAAARAVTPEAKARRRLLAEAFARKAQLCQSEPDRDVFPVDDRRPITAPAAEPVLN